MADKTRSPQQPFRKRLAGRSASVGQSSSALLFRSRPKGSASRHALPAGHSWPSRPAPTFRNVLWVAVKLAFAILCALQREVHASPFADQTNTAPPAIRCVGPRSQNAGACDVPSAAERADPRRTSLSANAMRRLWWGAKEVKRRGRW